MTKLGDKSRTTNMNGSCALGLGLVAAGHADALIQPLQSPWDWAAGKLLVEEAGGKIIFYEMEKTGKEYTKIVSMDNIKPRHYNPDERTLGFVAANENLAEQIMKMLLELQ
jgi:fructose-1,6-bisphosphatase/inositol monophosphatase family enzyme